MRCTSSGAACCDFLCPGCLRKEIGDPSLSPTFSWTARATAPPTVIDLVQNNEIDALMPSASCVEEVVHAPVEGQGMQVDVDILDEGETPRSAAPGEAQSSDSRRRRATRRRRSAIAVMCRGRAH